MTSIKRIGLITPAWPGQNTANGIATSVYYLAQGLREVGVVPVIFALQIDGSGPADVPVVQIRDLGWRWYDRLRARFGDSSLQGNRHFARNIAGAIRTASLKAPLDAVLIEESNGWAAMVQQLIQTPVFVVLHGPWVLHKALQSRRSVQEDQRREARERAGFMAAAGLIAPSRNVLEAVEATAPLADTPKIVLPNTLMVAPDMPLSVAKGPHDILFVGRFDRHKGGDTVLAAFAELLKTHPQARLTFAGPDSGVRQSDGSFVHMAAALAELPEAVKSAVSYKGRVDRADVARLRGEHAIAVIASRYEVFGYTVLEAMAAGQAIICTAIGGPAEILEDERTALLVPPDDASAMATALARMIDDPDLRGSLGAAARAEVETQFNPGVVAGQTVSFVRDALATSMPR